MSGLTTRAAPPEAAPETTLTASPWDWLYALIVGFGPMYVISSESPNSAVTASGPALKAVGVTVRPRGFNASL